ncbi:hypothetical protein Vretimale_2210 [Volvox reticuliferus]|uniref:Uncharacterized protein n=1 Tax=Volvox reticuliferus TaxID=1737510 RepID=A0A8J4FKI7_9CHLO|nr:hypothetical protein Vretifemale_4510 [Volvox reticuliferus]GIL96352.1 hypothetical protein Vretimale_2210 [Volvox reticuliferus]
MFSGIAKAAARPAAAAAAATVAANAVQGSVQARAPPQGARQAAHPPAHSKIVDRDTEGWVLAELKDEMVLFEPFNAKEVEEAAGTVMALFGGRSTIAPIVSGPIITEVSEDVDDGLANAVIEATAAATADAVAMGRNEERKQLNDLMAITTRMLRRPGMQREVVMCMLDDPEVRQLMMDRCNDLDRYLTAAGIYNPGLLPPPENISFTGDASSAGNAAGAGNAPRPGGPDMVSRLVGTVATVLQRAGGALAPLAGWLRRRLQALFSSENEERTDEGVGAREGAAAGGGGALGQTGQVLRTVMVLAVLVFCVMIIRKPLVLRALRRC